jgi:alcohol dehydrogenase
VLLPYVMEYNRPARPDEMAELSALMGGDAVSRVRALGLEIGLPPSLAELGVAQGDLRAMAAAAVGIKRLVDNNPAPLDVEALEAILDAAWHGEPDRLRATGAAVSP